QCFFGAFTFGETASGQFQLIPEDAACFIQDFAAGDPVWKKSTSHIQIPNMFALRDLCYLLCILHFKLCLLGTSPPPSSSGFWDKQYKFASRIRSTMVSAFSGFLGFPRES